MQIARTSQMKKTEIARQITTYDDPFDKRKGSVHVEEVVHNEPGGILIVSDQVLNKSTHNSTII